MAEKAATTLLFHGLGTMSSSRRAEDFWGVFSRSFCRGSFKTKSTSVCVYVCVCVWGRGGGGIVHTFLEILYYTLEISSFSRQTISHQRPLPLRPATSTVIIAFQAVTRPLLMIVAPLICQAYILFASNDCPCTYMHIKQVADAKH